MRKLRVAVLALALTALWLAFPALANGASWYVATNGLPANPGSQTSPWDLCSALEGKAPVKPGDTIWIAGGTYTYPVRSFSGSYQVRLVGEAGRPIRVQAARGERVTLDGGLTLLPPSTFLWFQDLEIIVSENLKLSRQLSESGSWPRGYDRPWGGLTMRSGRGCKFINLVIHDNAQGLSWWTESSDSEVYGCIIYDNGWSAPDRGHGHGIYTQNDAGTKTIADCILTGGYGYTLHAYGSSRADVNNYLVRENTIYNGGPFLIGGGKPSHGIRVVTNWFYNLPVQLGYNAPTNYDCEVRGNLLVDGALQVKGFQCVIDEGNFILQKTKARPHGATVAVRLNQFDPRRAHLVVFNWDRTPTVTVDVSALLHSGDKFRLLNPRQFFGRPVLTGQANGRYISVPVDGEFACFVLMKDD